MSIDPVHRSPTIISMAADIGNTAKDALKQAVNRQPVFADDELVKERWDTCTSCEHFDGEGSVIPNRCKLCGCMMKAKVKMLMAKCPANKWKK